MQIGQGGKNLSSYVLYRENDNLGTGLCASAFSAHRCTERIGSSLSLRLYGEFQKFGGQRFQGLCPSRERPECNFRGLLSAPLEEKIAI